MTGLDGMEQAAVRRLINYLADCDDDEMADLNPIEKVDRILSEWEQRKELEQRVDRLETLVEVENGKQNKIAKIVEYAHNQRDGRPMVELTAKEIRGATGVSERYSHQLTHPEDGLPADKEWIIAEQDVQQYGHLEIKKDGTDARTIAIDFEGVQSSGCPVNRFITDHAGTPTPEGGEA